MQQSEYSYLACPKEAEALQHEAAYIFKTVDGNYYRKVFQNVPLTNYESTQIGLLEKEIQNAKIQLPAEWSQLDALRILYNGKFKLKDTMERLQLHLQWRNNPAMHQLSQPVIDFLQSGIIYTFGRDHQFRPVIILNAHRIDTKKHSKEFIIQCLSVFFGFVRRHMLMPGKVENWIVIVETNDVGVFSLPTSGLGDVIKTMAMNFVGCLHRMYVLNPSTSLYLLWKTGTPFMDNEAKSKNVFVSKKEMAVLKQAIPANQLEQKFGGTQPNQAKFWPPVVP